MAWRATLAAGVAGGLWAGIAAALRRLSGVNEVLSTILLNLVAAAVVGWAVHGPLQEPGGGLPQSAPLPAGTWLGRPFPPGRLHLGLLLVVLAAAGVALAPVPHPLGARAPRHRRRRGRGARLRRAGRASGG